MKIPRNGLPGEYILCKKAVYRLKRSRPWLPLQLDDLISETYLRYLKAQKDNRIRGDVDGFIRGIAVHVVSEWARTEARLRRTREHPVLEVNGHERLGPSEEVLDDAEKRLTGRCRDLFTYLKKNDAFTHHEAAQAMGCTVRASEQAMYRIKRTFRDVQRDRLTKAMRQLGTEDLLNPDLHEFILNTAITPIERDGFRIWLGSMLNRVADEACKSYERDNIDQTSITLLSVKVMELCSKAKTSRVAKDPLFNFQIYYNTWNAISIFQRLGNREFLNEEVEVTLNLVLSALVVSPQTAYNVLAIASSYWDALRYPTSYRTFLRRIETIIDGTGLVDEFRHRLDDYLSD